MQVLPQTVTVLEGAEAFLANVDREGMKLESTVITSACFSIIASVDVQEHPKVCTFIQLTQLKQAHIHVYIYIYI